MCGRFAVGDTQGEDWADWLGIDGGRPWPAPGWNVAPGFCMAGLRAQATIGDAEPPSFTVLTCPAGEATRPRHPRGPVVLAEAEWQRWLAPESAEADRMRPAPDDRVDLREVGPEVGNMRNDGPALIEPAAVDI